MSRSTVLAVLAAASVTAAGVLAGVDATSSDAVRPAATTAAAVVVYQAPVTPLVVLRSFAPPIRRYGPGHLGIDLRSKVGADVRSAAAGTVTFAGQVAGRGVVVISHADGIRTEYEPVTPAVRSGSSVVAGQVIGRVSGRHRGCAGSCLHWGARRGTTYLDPLALLRPLGVVRLLPWRRER